jgi:hypothetical protein
VKKPMFDPYHLPPEAVREPPTTLWKSLRMIGPGILLAGTIVGSGELLVTTGLGATTGYAFLWLILFSCIIKVFVQIELGRYTIASGKPTLGALDEIPVPRLGANVLVWWWFIMMLATVFQLGGMTGTVGQAMHLTLPDFSSFLKVPFTNVEWFTQAVGRRPELPWAWLVCGATILLLWSGGYRRLELVTTVIVVSVTLLTLAAACFLPWTKYPIRWNEAAAGLNPFTLASADRRRCYRVVLLSLLVPGERLRTVCRLQRRKRCVETTGTRLDSRSLRRCVGEHDRLHHFNRRFLLHGGERAVSARARPQRQGHDCDPLTHVRRRRG